MTASETMSPAAMLHGILEYSTLEEGPPGHRILGVFIGNMVSAMLGE